MPDYDKPYGGYGGYVYEVKNVFYGGYQRRDTIDLAVDIPLSPEPKTNPKKILAQKALKSCRQYAEEAGFKIGKFHESHIKYFNQKLSNIALAIESKLFDASIYACQELKLNVKDCVNRDKENTKLLSQCYEKVYQIAADVESVGNPPELVKYKKVPDLFMDLSF